MTIQELRDRTAHRIEQAESELLFAREEVSTEDMSSKEKEYHDNYQSYLDTTIETLRWVLKESRRD